MSEQRCPACARRIINRRLPRCEFCDAPLPLEELLSANEMEASEERLDDKEKLNRLRREAERADRCGRRGR